MHNHNLEEKAYYEARFHHLEAKLQHRQAVRNHNLLETDLASRWKGVRLPRASGKSPDFPRKFPELPRKFFGDFPGSSLTVELNSNPEVPRKFPGLPRKFPRLPRKFPDFLGGEPLSLGSLTRSPDSQKLSLNLEERAIAQSRRLRQQLEESDSYTARSREFC